MNYLISLIKEKESKISSSDDKEKLQLVKDTLSVPNCFFKMDISTAIGIMSFLGVPEDKMESLYFSLIAPDKLEKHIDKVTVSKEK